MITRIDLIFLDINNSVSQELQSGFLNLRYFKHNLILLIITKDFDYNTELYFNIF